MGHFYQLFSLEGHHPQLQSKLIKTKSITCTSGTHSYLCFIAQNRSSVGIKKVISTIIGPSTFCLELQKMTSLSTQQERQHDFEPYSFAARLYFLLSISSLAYSSTLYRILCISHCRVVPLTKLLTYLFSLLYPIQAAHKSL